MGKKPQVNLRVFKGQKMSYDENGNPQNENQQVTLPYDTVQWKNYLKTLRANRFIRVDVESVFYVDQKKDENNFFVDTIKEAEDELVSKIKKEVKESFELPKPELTQEQKRIADLEAKLEALLSAGSQNATAKSNGKSDDLDSLKKEYEEVVGKKPHHMAKAETLKKEIEEAKN